ncbi:MAG TPA: addiction module antidote protein, HigA family [Nitratifractor sp.]|jgi:addiction module HigA family antidote|nr:addiction module antidote protein, HigA family [Nitratifractor sp.]HHD74694.1 addiction module antidote protein, HigA family [Nitratifractor sp.]HHH20848.1 addiction module antidote protein, HigA family [Nitratifractor sp.]
MYDLKRSPTHPGEILIEEFLKPLNISQTRLAQELKTSFRAINEVVNCKRGITVEMALRLSKFFGTSPELWLNLQNSYDLYRVALKKRALLESLSTFEESA